MTGKEMTRREATAALLAPLLSGMRKRECPIGVRAFRADATILLGIIPIYKRQGVGSGYALCRQTEQELIPTSHL
jgi:hypothetical protein